MSTGGSWLWTVTTTSHLPMIAASCLAPAVDDATTARGAASATAAAAMSAFLATDMGIRLHLGMANRRAESEQDGSNPAAERVAPEVEGDTRRFTDPFTKREEPKNV